MKRNPENTCRSCRRTMPLYPLKTLRGKLIHVCERCRQDLLELQTFLSGQSKVAMPPNTAIRFFRIPFVPSTSLPSIDLKTLRSSSIIEPDVLRKFPPTVFNKPDIVALHKITMRPAMVSDGVNARSISRKLVIPQYAVEEFLRLQIADPKTAEFHAFMGWVIDHGYSLNQTVQRSDVETLLGTPDTSSSTPKRGKFPPTILLTQNDAQSPDPTHDTV